MRDDASLGVTEEAAESSRFPIASIFIVLILLAPIVTVAAIWVPLIYNFNPIVQILALKDLPGGPGWRTDPSHRKLAFVSPGTFLPRVSGDQLIDLARSLLGEKFPVDGDDVRMLRMPFDKSAVFAGDSSWQLTYTGFLVPAILTRAYREVADERFLAAARDFILGWEAFERARWLPKGSVWNDHAIASRAIILAEFWHLYRQSALFELADAERIIQLAARTAALLANKRFYTYTSNHGTAQNVGLLKLIIFFPEFESITRYRDMAVERTLAQLQYYLSEEGIVREHSIGYHAYGVWLVQGIVKLIQHLGNRVPAEYLRRLRKAEEFIALVQRPDGTIPRSGDTKSTQVQGLRRMGLDALPPYAAPGPGNQPAREIARFFPKSGYVLHSRAGRMKGQRHEPPSQLMAFWGHFPHRKHKQSDDLSVHLWAGGIDWWTSVGYWPNARGDRDRALTWAGSNAPHRVGEPVKSLHRPRADYIGIRDDALFLELTRGSEGGFRANRQVLALPDQVWVVVDAYEDRHKGTARTVWLTGSDNAIEPVDSGNTNRYRVTSRGKSDTLAVSIIGSTVPTIRVAKGETDPIIGWIASRPPSPAPALVVETPLPSSWTANVAVLENNGAARLENSASMSEWTSTHQWSLDVPMLDGKLEIGRDKDAIVIRRGNEQRVTKIALRRVTNQEQSYANELSAYREQKNLYARRLIPVKFYRLKMTWLVLGLGLASFVFILLVCRLWTSRSRERALAVPVVSWIGLNIWLHFVYF